jgi:GxxExxY protein
MLLYEELTFKVRKAIFNVYNTLGYGHKENVYQKAVEKEFIYLEIPFKSQENIDVVYRGEKVGLYRPDFIVEDKIIIEIKAIEFVPKTCEAQLFHYLKSTTYKIGFLVNFGSNKLFLKRFIWTKDP